MLSMAENKPRPSDEAILAAMLAKGPILTQRRNPDGTATQFHLTAVQWGAGQDGGDTCTMVPVDDPENPKTHGCCRAERLYPDPKGEEPC
jgi:hypothetical protein